MLTRKSPVKLKAKLLEEGRAWEALQAQCWCGKLLSREPPQSLSYLWTQNPHSSTKQETLQEFEHPWVRIMLIINPRFSRNIPILNITSHHLNMWHPYWVSIHIHYQARKSWATISLLNTHLREERWRDEERGLLNISHVTLGFCLQISLRGPSIWLPFRQCNLIYILAVSPHWKSYLLRSLRTTQLPAAPTPAWISPCSLPDLLYSLSPRPSDWNAHTHVLLSSP